MRKITTVALGAAALFAVSTTAEAQVNIVGTTTGCFFQGSAVCTTGTSTATAGNLTFTGGSFNVTTGPTSDFWTNGSASDNLGLFSMGTSDFNFNPPGSNNTYGFRLFVTISSPTTTPGSTAATGVFGGELNINSSNDKLDINFDNSDRLFTYANGDFKLGIYDVSDIKKGDRNEYVGFKITCDHSAPNCTPPVSTVPEPSTYALMAAGLAGLGFVSRRRRKA